MKNSPKRHSNPHDHRRGDRQQTLPSRSLILILTQLQHLYELILEQPLDKRNFRKKVTKLGILAETNEVEKDVARRAARLYRFDRSRYRKLQKQGINFEL